MQWIGLFRLSGAQLLLSIVMGTAVCVVVMNSVTSLLVRLSAPKGGV